MSKNILVILAHPNKESFNQALLKRTVDTLEASGHQVRVNDLYEQAFDPVLKGSELAGLQKGVVAADVLREQAHLSWADGLVILYPLWWLDRPAILKGWFDRVFTHGFAFSYGPNGVQGMLDIEQALVVVTIGSSEEDLASMGMGRERLVNAVTEGSLGFAGIEQLHQRLFYRVPAVNHEERVSMMDELAADLQNYWPGA